MVAARVILAVVDAVRNAIRMLKPDQITKDLDAVAVYLNKEVPSFNGKLAWVGSAGVAANRCATPPIIPS